VFNGRAAPIVEVVGQATATRFEKHAFFLREVFVLEDVNHVEDIVALGLSDSHHAVEEMHLALAVSILDYIVKTVRRIDLVIPGSDYVRMFVLKENILRSSCPDRLRLLFSIGEELKATGGEGVKRDEVGDGLILNIVNHKRADNSFLGQQEMFNIGFSKANVNFVSTQMGVEDSVYFGNIILSHFSESGNTVLLVQLVILNHATHAHLFG